MEGWLVNCCCTSKRPVTDTVQNCFTFRCKNKEKRLLWEAENLQKPSGTFVVTVLEACDEVKLFLNGKFLKELKVGQSAIFTADPLEKLEVECKFWFRDDDLDEGCYDKKRECKIDLCLVVNYEVC